MNVSNQLLRIIKEEIQNIDFGTVRITVNKAGSYTEIATERKVRVIKTSDELDTPDYHKG